mmetsp:Transcript_8497/g.18710  ORF Transcript_8497/g.18710 Transcript_8497/m.18710 type:complete len:223 (+) Transcript_8497:233-901(+)
MLFFARNPKLLDRTLLSDPTAACQKFPTKFRSRLRPLIAPGTQVDRRMAPANPRSLRQAIYPSIRPSPGESATDPKTTVRRPVSRETAGSPKSSSSSSFSSPSSWLLLPAAIIPGRSSFSSSSSTSSSKMTGPTSGDMSTATGSSPIACARASTRASTFSDCQIDPIAVVTSGTTAIPASRAAAAALDSASAHAPASEGEEIGEPLRTEKTTAEAPASAASA